MSQLPEYSGAYQDVPGNLLDFLKKRVLIKKGVLVGAAIVTIYLAITPFVFVLWTSIWSGPPGSFEGQVTLAHFVAAYTDPSTYEVMFNSFAIAIGMLSIAMFFGIIFAWLFARTEFPTKDWMELVILSPYAVPGFVYAFMFIFLFGPRIGLANTYLIEWFGFDEAVFDIFTIWGVIFVVGIDSVTTAYLLIVPALRNMDPSIEEVSRIHGGDFYTTLTEVSLPVVKPAIASATLITFVKGLGTFSAVAIIGLNFNFHVFSTKVWVASTLVIPPAYGYASALSVTLLLITAVLIWYYRRITKRKEDFMTITGSGYQPRKWKLGKWKWPLTLSLWVVVLAIWVVPVAVLALVAFHPVWLGEVSPGLMTLEHFDILTSSLAKRAFYNSFVLGIVGGLIGVFLVTLFSYYTERTDYRFRGVADFLSLTPMAAPSIIFGASVLFTYLWLGKLTGIELIGTLTVIIIGLIGKYLPTISRMAAGSIVQIHNELEGVARTHGASWSEMMVEIFFPLYKGTMGVIFFYLFVHMFRALSIPLLLYGTGSETVSVIIFNAWTARQNLEQVAVLSIAFILIMAVILVAIRLAGYSFHEVA